MPKASSLTQAREPKKAAPDAGPVVTVEQVREAVARIAVITPRDRLHLFAGDDDDEAKEAPRSIARDPELLLAWCERYQPRSVLGAEEAGRNSRNRVWDELSRHVKNGDQKRQPSLHEILDLQYRRRTHDRTR